MRIAAALLLAITAFAVLAIPASAHAQRVAQIAVAGPAPDSSAKPLQVLDDYGTPILEVDIRDHMKTGVGRWLMQPLGLVVGAVTMYQAVPKGKSTDNCSVYDPCSDRQKYYRGSAAVVGAIVGVLVVNAAVPERSRTEAIEAIRAERRVHHRPRT